MNRSCVSCLKTLVTFLHFICWLCGAFVQAFGVFGMFKSKFGAVITTWWPNYASNTLIVVGALACCVCYLGILGGMQENYCMLISFYITLFLLMLVELAMSCIFLVVEREIDRYFETDMVRAFNTYKQSSYGGNQTVKDDFDAIQSIFKCCGVYGIGDWEGNVPISCCVEDPCNIFPQISWQGGCYTKLRAWFKMNFLSLGAGVVSLFILQFLCLSISVPIFWNFKVTGRGYK
ncbi:leukocyte surface antigen CD53-like [Chanos chanos]|uniref:Tetraspanin n=1 Tax=Chanos chanos TaxID=29144 RepID=A0A6J2WTT1_CHACN|nr:leukocyte surface antigen CD53-like [Chanos chanos]